MGGSLSPSKRPTKAARHGEGCKFFFPRRGVCGAKEDDELSVSLERGRKSAICIALSVPTSATMRPRSKRYARRPRNFVDQRDTAAVKDPNEGPPRGRTQWHPPPSPEKQLAGSGMALYFGNISHIERRLRAPQRIEPRARSSLYPQSAPNCPVAVTKRSGAFQSPSKAARRSRVECLP